MIRFSILVAFFALAACNGTPALESVHCTIDSSCPFEQCCVSGTCVDPGPAGSCVDVAEATSALVIAETVVAGETVPFSAHLSDTHGRPVAGISVIVAIESSCPECETVATLSETTDASGIVSGTFMSTRAEPKTFTVSSGGGGSATKMITVVAGDAVGLGFAGVVDTPVNQPLSGIAVTRVDAYGNPDAAPSLTLMDGLSVEVALADNPLELGLWRNGAALGPAPLSVTLEGKRVSIGEVSVPLVVHGLTLSGHIASAASAAPFVSEPFSIIGPHFTSAMPDPLVAADGEIRVDWSVTPQVDARIIDGNILGPQFSKADSGASFFPTFVSGAAHVRVSELEPRIAYDVEAVQLSRGDGFFGTADTGAVIDRVHALPDGDVLALGRFWGELVLTPSARITGISAYTSTYQSFIARFSNDFTQVRWYAATYGFSSAATPLPGVASIIRDSEVTSDGGVLVLTQFTADATGWDYQASGARQRCVTSGGGTRAGASLARFNATGILASCASLHDAEKSNAVVPRSLRTLGSQHYVALNVVSDVAFYSGSTQPASGQPVFTGDIAPPYLIQADTSKHDCGTASVGLIVPLLDTNSGAAPLTVGTNVVTTQVLVQVESMEVDAAGTGLNIGATVCAAGSSLQSGTGMSVTTTGNDGMILHLSGQTLTPVWQSTCAGDDGPMRATALEDGTYAVMMNFAAPCALDPHQAASPSSGIAVGRVRASRGLTASSILSSAGAILGRGFERRGDRIVFSAYAAADLSIAGTPYAGVYGSGVILLAETDPNFNVRWSSPSTNMNGSSGAFDLMENGRTLVTMNGSPQTMKAAPLDASPPSTPTSSGQLRPVVYTLEPYDFVLRDVR